jgi:hypothetical protein
MNLHTDIPTQGQVGRPLENRRPVSVSIYVPTDPLIPAAAILRYALGS